MLNKRIIMIILMATGVFSAGLMAQEDDLSKNEKQQAKELEQTEKYLDGHIKELNDELKYYTKLKDYEIKLTPGKTVFTNSKKTEKDKDQSFLELESYTFIPASFVSNASVGTRSKSMRLYYSGDALSKVETTMIEDNFMTKTTSISVIVDPTPATDESGDILIRTLTLKNNTPSSEKKEEYLKKLRDTGTKPTFDLGEFYEGKLADMQNTVSNPLRVNFKRDFYVKNLRYFENNYRFTEDFYRRYGKDSDSITIQTLKQSLQY